jgi:SAM-dependent methyltransferase
LLQPLTTRPSPSQINYLDLIEPPDGSSIATSLRPDTVAEVQGKPVLFVVSESKLADSPTVQQRQLSTLSLGLACRGDDVFLARIRPGELLVERASLVHRKPDWRVYRAGSREALTFFSRLAQGDEDLQSASRPGRASAFLEMLRLLTHVADRLATRLARADVLSLLGRALFFRFLLDRAIISPRDLGRICPSASDLNDCFANAENSTNTSQWLDRTFNGNFLPLSRDGGEKFFQHVRERYSRTFEHLSAIVHRWQPAGEEYQTTMGWANFDFAHVPVGLLSQVYEAFCWKWEHRNAKLTSVHYTPRHLADLLVEEAFDGFSDAAKARVLDCACGAGVFLGLAFRRLYREQWEANGVRPDTSAIRSILEKQLTGFDISDSALKLSALTLYLTAIELDPTPIPPEKLRFKDLSGSVLFNHRQDGVDPLDGPVMGSLGDHIGDRFDKKFDIVLSKLKKSTRRHAHRHRDERIYKGPLVLIKESPGADRRQAMRAQKRYPRLPQPSTA